MTKIEALKQTIENVESGKYEHNWGSYGSCHCGVVARTLLNGRFPHADFEKIKTQPLNSSHDLFSDRAHCMITGIKIPKVFRVLKEAGFTPDELRELEYLGNEQVAKLAGLTVSWEKDLKAYVSQNFTSKTKFLSYLRAWVEILEADEQPKYADLTKELAILPANETPDTKLITVKA